MTLSTLKAIKIQSLTCSLVNSYRIKMTDKKPQKLFQSKSSKPIKTELVTSSQLVTYDPQQVTPVNPHSIMTSLGNPYTKPTFSLALVNDYNPFAHRSDPPVSSNFIQHPPSSPYFHRFSSNLFYIEKHHKHLTNPLDLVKANFPTNLHFPHLIPIKTLTITQISFAKNDPLK